MEDSGNENVSGHGTGRLPPDHDEIIRILKKELVLSLGCTEPAAVAYAAAVAADHLREACGSGKTGCSGKSGSSGKSDGPEKADSSGKTPEAGEEIRQIVVKVSKNIFKNVRDVHIPGAGDLRGVKAAAALGAFFGDSSEKLQAIRGISAEDTEKCRKFIESGNVSSEIRESGKLFDIDVHVFSDGHDAEVRLTDDHTHISFVAVDGKIIFGSADDGSIGNEGVMTSSRDEDSPVDYDVLTPGKIFEFVSSVKIEDVRNLTDAQTEFNMKLSECGLSERYGAEVGRVCADAGSAGTDEAGGEKPDIRTEVISKTTAGVDARMSGCPHPAVINCGSGNQGITSSVPVIVYGKRKGYSDEMICRGLLMSDLTAICIRQKCGILSACCGAVAAGAGAGAGIAYMEGLDPGKVVSYVLGTLGGMFCDGAKSSCASKVYAILSVVFLALESQKRNVGLPYGEGILGPDFERSVENYGKISKEGMKGTDDSIIEIMFSES